MRRNKPVIEEVTNPDAAPTKKMKISHEAALMAGRGGKSDYNNLSSPGFTLQQTFSLPEVPAGVIPKSKKLAMDKAFIPIQSYGYDSVFAEGLGFLGYPTSLNLPSALNTANHRKSLPRR